MEVRIKFHKYKVYKKNENYTVPRKPLIKRSQTQKALYEKIWRLVIEVDLAGKHQVLNRSKTVDKMWIDESNL